MLELSSIFNFTIVKKYFFFGFLSFVLLFCSCSSHLNEKQVKQIFENSVQDRNDWFFNKPIGVGNVFGLGEHNMEKYRKLSEQGFISMTELDSFIYGKGYNVTLTEKGKEYFSYESEIPGINPIKLVYLKTCAFEIASVKDIHENPSDNTAKATIAFKISEKTPLYDILKQDAKDFEKTFSFFKTTDGDWKLDKNLSLKLD